MAKTLPLLPADYYLQHFNELLRHLQMHYQPVLSDEFCQLAQAFWQLPPIAQRLWVRLLNRKGPVFALADIQYPEVPDQAVALAALQQAGLIAALETEDDCWHWLQRATKPELQQLLQCLHTERNPTAIAMSSLKKTANRAQLVAQIAALMPLEAGRLQAITPTVVLRQQQTLQYGYFLFFGRIEHNLSAFTLRDLGLQQNSNFKSSYRARYTEPALAQQAFFYANLHHEFRQLQQRWPKLSELEQQQTLNSWQVQLADWPVPLDERNQLVLEQLCEKLGRLAEKQGNVPLAIHFYQHCRAYPASERLVRLFYARRQQPQDLAALQQLLQQMQQDPCCDDEYWFAQDFSGRKFGQQSHSDLTLMLQQAGTIRLDELWQGQTEAGACRYYQQQGFQAFHSENQLWLALFGLLFWQELFLSAESAIYNEFEKRPRDLTSGGFYRRQALAIEQKLQLLAQPEQAIQLLLQNLTQFYPKSNAVFNWWPELAEQLPLLLRGLPAAALMTLLRQMATDFRRYSHGFPDLCLVAANGEITFVELKARGDAVRRNQLSKMLTMRQLGLAVQLVKVDWWADPDRSYVVVDVETTGGRPEQDRIIEIAALKVQRGVVVDRCCYLLDPERRVPGFITRLTGITPQMLQQAPRFAQIAGELSAFLADSIFVAHNVNFDYGFVRAELQRCGYSLGPSKLCTVVQMRRCYPGLASYGLAALAAHFAIDLTSHHRAEADATATVALLALIHQAEQESVSAKEPSSPLTSQVATPVAGTCRELNLTC
jgi:DNA polymerase-3 subunit epsilon